MSFDQLGAAEQFFTDWAEAGYGNEGEVTAVDVSVYDSANQDG